MKLAALTVLLGASTALAQPSAPADYAPDSPTWNGLSTLSALARGLGLQVYAPSALDWQELEESDVLFILYPRARLEPVHVAAFIRNGGHVLLADDFGASDEAVARLGMLRTSGIGVAAEAFHDDQPFAPIASPVTATHPLARDVGELTTNHPAVLRELRGPKAIFELAPGEAVVAAGSVGGSGRFVVLSDPSVLINRMLQLDGNVQFAINVLRFLSRPQSKRLVLLIGNFDLRGAPSDAPATPDADAAALAAELNRWLEEGNDYLLTTVGLRAVAVLAAVVLALLGLAVLPRLRKQALDGRWTRANHPLSDDVASVVARFDSAQSRNYLLPAAILRDSVDRALAAALKQPEPLQLLQRHQLLAEVEVHLGQDAAARLAHLHRRLFGLPSRTQAASPWSAGFVSRREFERLDTEVAALCRRLEAGLQ